MSGIHQKQQPHPPPFVGTENNGGSRPGAIPIDTLWNIGFNIVLVVSIILVGWLCYRALRQYILHRISQWNGFDRHIEQKENGSGDSDQEEEETHGGSRSPRRQKDNVRFRK